MGERRIVLTDQPGCTCFRGEGDLGTIDDGGDALTWSDSNDVFTRGEVEQNINIIAKANLVKSVEQGIIASTQEDSITSCTSSN